jgi:3-oxoadipate enol-lactonase
MKGMSSIGRLRYLERAPSPDSRPRGTLVLLHAFPLNARMWEPQLAFASRGWRVLAPHMRGLDEGGGPTPPAGDEALRATPTIDECAGDVIDLLDSLHVEEAVIGGLSMGGYVALAMLRHAPRYFRGLVLADTRPQADTPEGLAGRKRMLQLVAEGGAAAVAADMIPKLLGETTRLRHPDVAERVRSLVLSNSAASIAGMVHVLMSRPDSTPVLPTIHFPTLIIVGDQDTVTPPAVAEDMRRSIAGSTLVVLPEAGHLSSLEQPAAFDAALAQFLDHRV